MHQPRFWYGVGLWTRSLIRTNLTTLLAASKTVIISSSSSALCPSFCWGQRLNSEGHRHFMRVHHVHIGHGQAKAGLLGFALTKVLEQRHIIKEYPDFCKISGHVQGSMVYHLQQPQLFTIWVALWRRSAEIDLLTHLPSDRVFKDESKWNWGEKGTSSKECFWCFEACIPVHVKAFSGNNQELKWSRMLGNLEIWRFWL